MMRRIAMKIPRGNTVRLKGFLEAVSLVGFLGGGLGGGLVVGLVVGSVVGLEGGLMVGLVVGLVVGSVFERDRRQGAAHPSVHTITFIDSWKDSLMLGMVGLVPLVAGYAMVSLGSQVFAKGLSLLATWRQGLASRLPVAMSAVRDLLPGSKATRETKDVTLETSLEYLAKELAHAAQMLPEGQREATLLSAIDKLHEQAQTPDDVAHMARDIGRGMLDTALRNHLGQPDSFARLWDSVTVRLLGAGVAIATVLTIVTSLSQLLAGDLDAGRFVALVALLVGAGLLGGVVAVGEVRRRQP